MFLEEILLLGKPQQTLKKFAKQRLDGHCIYCGYECDNLTADHIKPRCRSGPTAHFNLAPSCVEL
jgi:5-methylcytosine-specific restriction endonuclease McrA